MIKGTIRKWTKSFLLAILLVWAIAQMVATPKVVSRSSMEPSYFPGDLVIVSRWPIGPRMPVTIGIPYTPLRLKKITLPVWRLRSGVLPDIGDVLVFNYPGDSGVVDRKRIMIKRCVALPGDTLQIRAGELYLNGQWVKSSWQTMNNYEIRGEKADFLRFCELIDPYATRNRLSKKNKHLINLTREEAALADSLFPQLSAFPAVYEKGKYPGSLFPSIESKSWTPDDYGPVYIPAKGDSIALNAENITRYESIIRRFEGRQISNNGDSLYIDGEFCSHYRFEQNYFFVLGDNHHNSIDSRHWGPVPENHLTGQVALTLFSFDPKAPWYKKIRWNKLFKTS